MLEERVEPKGMYVKIVCLSAAWIMGVLSIALITAYLQCVIMIAGVRSVARGYN